MCGISGGLQRGVSEDKWLELLGRMAQTLVHRGPDDAGVWCDAEAGVGLAHRRLSIVDLSAAGHQPMTSPDARFTISYNGEIYNFPALRQELEARGHGFRGHSDTEVTLAAFSEWGVEAAVKRFVGMFAFAVWDARERILHLCRDRVGEKPLYYAHLGDALVFGSELKALRVHPLWRGEIGRATLALLLRYNYIPAPYSIYKNVFKLLPGTILTVSADALQSRELPAPRAYWSAREVVETGAGAPFTGSVEEAAAELENLLRDAIAGQMVADVPLGAFLSGGIDSSLIVALMQAQSKRPVKTFTIGFHEEAYNEAKFAKAVAGHLGTEHTELYVTPKEALAMIPRLPTLYDEPFADSSQIPTFLVSQLTRRSVTVSLSGDGGDELFGGYNRYLTGQSIWEKVNLVPQPIRRAAAASLSSVSPSVWDTTFQSLGPVLPSRINRPGMGERLHKLSHFLNAKRPEVIFRSLVSEWTNPAELVLGAFEPTTIIDNQHLLPALPDFVERMMYLDLMTYLPDDILVKVDRAAMGVSLETRVPYLDYRVVEFAWRLPLALKVRGDKGKWLLRQILYKYIPPELIERPKTGFGIPIDSWLRGPLRAWAEELLDEGRLKREGFFDPRPIRQKWTEHLSGSRNWQYQLWGVLMVQAWLDQGG